MPEPSCAPDTPTQASLVLLTCISIQLQALVLSLLGPRYYGRQRCYLRPIESYEKPRQGKIQDSKLDDDKLTFTPCNPETGNLGLSEWFLTFGLKILVLFPSCES
jgi:hypothetical protein